MGGWWPAPYKSTGERPSRYPVKEVGSETHPSLMSSYLHAGKKAPWMPPTPEFVSARHRAQISSHERRVERRFQTW